MKVLPINTESFFKKAIGVAECYGFSNIDDLNKVENRKNTSILGLDKHKSSEQRFEHQVLSDVLKKYTETMGTKRGQPLMFYTPSVIHKTQDPSTRISALTLNTMGTSDPLAEVVLLKSSISILEELGIRQGRLRINSIGDRDSSVRFIKEATNHVKHRINDLPQKLLEMFRANPGAALAQMYHERHPLSHTLPNPIEYLTTPSRKYFKEVLELLEIAEIPFELHDKLYADPSVYTHTIFEIIEDAPKNTETNEEVCITLARGGRYDELTRPYVRGTLPSTGIVIAMRTKDQPISVGRPRRRKANACLVHIGKEARLRSIEIVEVLRRKKIPIEQCLYFERFSDQMAYAKKQNPKFIVIIGQQEARDGVALMRDTLTHAQRVVPIELLPEYLKLQ